MRDENLKKLLRAVEKPRADTEKKEASIQAVLLAAAHSERRVLHKISYGERIRCIAGYISFWSWFLQGAVAVMAGYLAVSGDVRFVMIVGCVMPLLACIACTEVRRGYTCGMWELEKACRYDLRQVMLLKMQIMGLVDIVIALGLAAFGTEMGMGLPQAILMILVPYFLSGAVFFFLLCKTDRQVSNYVLTGAGILMAAVCYMIPELCSGIWWRFINSHAEWAALILLVSVDLLLLAVRRFLKECDVEEKRTWSCD